MTMKWKDLKRGTVYSFIWEETGKRNYCHVLGKSATYVINHSEYSDDPFTSDTICCDGFKIEGIIPHEFLK